MSPSSSGNLNRKKKGRRSRRRELENIVRELRAENERLRGIATDASSGRRVGQEPIVQRPRGSAGYGFNLRHAMGLGDNLKLYRSIQRTVRALVGNAGLDHRVIWRRQPKEVIGKVLRVARKRQPYLRRFVNDWATEELAKQYLKNRRAYCRRMNYDQDDAAASQYSGEGTTGSLPHIDDVDCHSDDDVRVGATAENDAEDEDRGEGPSGCAHEDEGGEE
ncbi:hypothetical protein NUW54_g6424 [Trametes sanguinea]|uniref:Uncharacterized protein n=1 Tax=Trametes sanguinea TaxID=158606 RepID=A0ACC1PUE8_9APHY|nr:hypothetical protein NUW54_g6424 [Trametes sanguinea]